MLPFLIVHFGPLGVLLSILSWQSVLSWTMSLDLERLRERERERERESSTLTES